MRALDDPIASEVRACVADLTASSAGLPLPKGADLKFWRSEVESANTAQEKLYPEWQTNIDWYTGKSPDAAQAAKDHADFVNVNVDFYQVEQKLAQLFYETPELQLSAKGALKLLGQMGQPGAPASDDQQRAVLGAHRALLDELLGDDHADILSRAVHPAIKDCLCVSGVGPVLLGYEPTLREIPAPAQFGSMLGLQDSVKVPIYERWYGLHFSPRKFLKPADCTDTDWDRAPWLGMRFRMPLTVAKREGLVPDTFNGTNTRDEHVLNDASKASEPSGVQYVDGQAIWYRAAIFDATAAHPELYRELILIDGLDKEARHRDSPHQTLLPNGRLSGDSMMGNPIHPLSIRFVPDTADTPSDAQMTRPLVRELCKFRTQMVQERDANILRVVYDSEKFPPEVLEKIKNGTLGTMIGLEPGALAQGIGAIMAEVTKGSTARQTYLANDYITHDIEKTHAMDATAQGVSGGGEESATKTALVERNRNVRLDHERRQVLRWYLRLVDKMSALACRYVNPVLASQLLGDVQAQAWLAWDKQSADARLAFTAKPDSQIHVDGAARVKQLLDLYQFCAKDPNVVRVELLKELFAAEGLDPSKLVIDQLPPQHPDPSLAFSFKGEDVIGPQAPIVLEILAQGGIQISQEAIDQAGGQLFKQIALGLRDASGKATPAVTKPQEHGGTAEQVRPLSQQSADKSGQRSGPPTEGATH